MRRDVRALKRQAKWLNTFAHVGLKEIQNRAARGRMADMYAAFACGRARWGHPEPPPPGVLQRFQKHMALLFKRLAQGMTETLELTERFVIKYKDGGAVIRPEPRENTINVIVVDIFRTYGDRFRTCPVCGRGFFKFGRAQYCSRPCSDTGRREVYRGKKRSAKGETEESASHPSFSPRRRRRRTRKSAQPLPVSKPVSPPSASIAQVAEQEADGRLAQSEIDAILADVSAYLKPRAEYWLTRGDEASNAVQQVLYGIWRVLKAGRVIKNPRAYARRCLKRASANVFRDRARREVG